MKDVAARAGVSITTVSHVLNKTRAAAPETRARILQAVRELNYHKNVSACLLKRGQSDCCGLIISDIENPFFPELVKGFEMASLAHGFDVLVCATNYDRGLAKKAVGRMIENTVRGVAVMTSQLESRLVEELCQSEVPVVLLDSGSPRRGRSGIRVDYSHGAREAVKHLCHLGHRTAAVLAGPGDRRSAVAYKRTVLGILSQFGLNAALVRECEFSVAGGLDGALWLLQQSSFPTAIITGNDLTAIGVMQGLADAGIRIPEDVSIVGVDDIAFAQYTHPSLTTVRVPRGRLGELAFEAIEKILRSKRRLGKRYVLRSELIVRRSTGRAPEGKCVAAREGSLSPATTLPPFA